VTSVIRTTISKYRRLPRELRGRSPDSIKEQVEAAVVRGETLEQTRQIVNLDELQRLFAGESRMRKLIFRNYVIGPAVEAAFRDAATKP
jgi:hypothetical protein